MRRWSLGTLLTVLNVGLVAAVVAAVALAAAGLLRRLADDQALARVGLAGAGAVRSIEDSGADLQISARLLAERPTLAAQLAAGDFRGLQDFLARFRKTS